MQPPLFFIQTYRCGRFSHGFFDLLSRLRYHYCARQGKMKQAKLDINARDQVLIAGGADLEAKNNKCSDTPARGGFVRPERNRRVANR